MFHVKRVQKESELKKLYALRDVTGTVECIAHTASICKIRLGNSAGQVFGEDFFTGSEYRALSAAAEANNRLMGHGGVIRRGNREKAVAAQRIHYLRRMIK